MSSTGTQGWRTVLLDGRTLPDQGWSSLHALIRARLLVAALALPFGVLLRPEQTPNAAWLVGVLLVSVVLLSAVLELVARLRRGLLVQMLLHLAVDLTLITVASAFTGGRDSQFVLFYALVVITGGIMAGLPGGLFASAGACLGFVGLPWLGQTWTGLASNSGSGTLPKPELLVAFLAIVGALAGVLGERVQRTRDDLARTTRELDRIRVDNDLILRHLATGVFTVDQHGVVAYMNPAAEQVLGLRTLEARGRHIRMAVPDRLAGLRELVVDTLVSCSGRTRAELTLYGPTGRALPVGVSTNVLMHEGEMTGVVAVFQDLTHVQEMERRMRRSETLAEVGALAAGIAHELRNGLKPISGSVEYLQRELEARGRDRGADGARQPRIGPAQQVRHRPAHLLARARTGPDAGRPRRAAARHRARLQHDPRRAAGVDLAIETRGGRFESAADPDQLRQVWLNLAANALEAMGEQGRLDGRDPARGRRPARGRVFTMTAPASRRRTCRASVSPSLQPSAAVRAWGWRSHNGSSSAMAAS